MTTAHEKYADNLIKGLKAGDIAVMFALPPSVKNKSAHRVEDIHEVVTTFGTDETKAKWADLLADAAGEKRGEDWPADWAVGIFAIINAKELAVKAEVREIRAA